MVHPWVVQVRKVGLRLAFFAAAIGVAGMAARTAHNAVLGSLPGVVDIQHSAALCLMLLGAAATLRSETGPSARCRELCALAAFAVAMAPLAEYAAARAFSINQADLGILAAHRMAPFSAVAFGLLALGFLGIDLRSNARVHPAELAAGAGGAIGLLALLDLAYGFTTLSVPGNARINAAAATGILAVAGALLAARPVRGLMAALTSPRMGGILLRRALWPVVALTCLEGLIAGLGERQGYLTPAGSQAALTLGFIVMIAAVLLRTASLLDRADVARAAVQADLESRVTVRTAKLSAANAELEEQRAAVARARDEALNASRVKSDFLANVTHELRTPMNGVIGMLEAVLESPLDPAQAQQLRTARASAADLLAQIDDILDVTALETGQLRLALAPFEVAKLVQASVEPSRMRASRNKLQLTARVQPDVPTRLAGDARRVQQVLGNLVSNAVKFTREGLVRIEVATGTRAASRIPAALDTPELSADYTIVRFSVTDTGPGIAPERHGELFQTFHQLDTSAARSHGGTGLGLAISAQLVELMDGRIGVESQVGVGSTFWFEVPLARVSALRPVGDGGRVRGLAMAIGVPALRRTASVFLDHLEPMVNQIAEATRSGCASDLHLATHRLRGSAATFGVETLAALCGEFEKCARSGFAPGQAASLIVRLPELEAAATRARQDLTRWLDEVEREGHAPIRLIRTASNA